MAVAEDAGGWGATELELALIAEQYGRAVASAPIIEAQVAAGLLARCAEAGAGLLADVVKGDKLITFAPRAARGVALGGVPAGAVADGVVALVDGRLVAVSAGEGRRAVENLSSLPVADIPAGDVVVLAEDEDARRYFSDALDLWLTLTAAA